MADIYIFQQSFAATLSQVLCAIASNTKYECEDYLKLKYWNVYYYNAKY